MSTRAICKGFTAIELVITMAIFAILIGLGVPGFQSILLDRKQASETSNLRKSMVFARSEAIKRAQHVSVCARATDTTCGSDWSEGWLVHTDSDTGSPGVLDADDTILRSTDLSLSRLSIHAKAMVRPAPLQAQSSIRFSPRGRADWSLGTLVLCDHRGEKHASGLVINGAGSLRAAYSDASSAGVVLDATGTAIVCT